MLGYMMKNDNEIENGCSQIKEVSDNFHSVKKYFAKKYPFYGLGALRNPVP